MEYGEGSSKNSEDEREWLRYKKLIWLRACSGNMQSRLNVPQGQEIQICRSALIPHRMHPSLTDICMYQDCQCLQHRIILADTYSDINRPDLLFIFGQILL